MEQITLPSPIADAWQAAASIATHVDGSSDIVQALQLSSALTTAVALPSPIELEDTET
jgi:hypothetical protein